MLKNFISTKSINLLLLAVFAGIAYFTSTYWTNVCTQGGCDFGLRNSFLKPLLWGSFGLTFSFITLLFFPSQIFNEWLRKIFWWFFGLSIIGISQIDIHSSSILTIERGQMAWLLGFVLFCVTVIFIIGTYIRDLRKMKITKTECKRLLILVPIVAIVLFIRSQFSV